MRENTEEGFLCCYFVTNITFPASVYSGYKRTTEHRPFHCSWIQCYVETGLMFFSFASLSEQLLHGTSMSTVKSS